MSKPGFQDYKEIPVMVTGHTGFKGTWLSLWLSHMGAEVYGLALAPDEPERNFFLDAGIDEICNSEFGDIRNLETVVSNFNRNQPKIIFHLAAQSLVRRSYDDPVTTFETNVMGTTHVLEAARQVSSVKAVIIVTSDKCYDNTGDKRQFSEGDPLGGSDPYSSSKGCAELVTAAYRRSFAQNDAMIASARAGNVIGGGDWSEDRLVPDIVKAIERGEPVAIRNPEATRPWQHVLDPLYGYLTLGAHLLTGDKNFAGSWNFGPNLGGGISVKALSEKITKIWGRGTIEIRRDNDAPPEAKYLDLDIAKAKRKLKFNPAIGIDRALELTVNWYRQYLSDPSKAREITLSQIQEYVNISD